MSEFPTRRLRWETLATGAELSATVVMASGFVLPLGQSVREHYRIMRMLGKGGMGRVLGISLVGSADQQVFALKMIARPAVMAPDGQPMNPVQQKQADAQAAAFAAILRQEAAKQDVVQRHGVAVARLFALVQFDDGSLGLRMEIARGRSLESVVEEDARERRGEPPDAEFALSVMRKLLQQLRRLHEIVDPGSPSGFVHSDIKPGNVYVDDHDRRDPHVALIDFGVATAGQSVLAEADTIGLPRESFVLEDTGGTIGFAPPHHFTGKPTPLSDVYAAIAMLYELLALDTPWQLGELTRTAANVFKVEDAMRAGPRPLRSVRASIPVEIAELLDPFFVTEFRALQELADRAHEARSGSDAGVRRAMTERLTHLAKEFIEKIDALQAAVAPTRGSSVDVVRVSSEPRVSGEPASVRRSIVDDEPLELPMRRGWGGRLFLLVVLLAGSAGAYAYLRGVPPQFSEALRVAVARVRGEPIATEPRVVPPVLPAPIGVDAIVESTSVDANVIAAATETEALDAAAMDAEDSAEPDVETMDDVATVDDAIADDLDADEDAPPDADASVSADVVVVAHVQPVRARPMPARTNGRGRTSHDGRGAHPRTTHPRSRRGNGRGRSNDRR